MENNLPAGQKAVDEADASATASMAKTAHVVAPGANTGGQRTATVLIAASLLLIVFSISIMAAVPPVSRDALTHHLAVPKLWIKQGGIHEIPSVPFSYSPMNLDLLYAVPLLMGNDIVPKYIHFLFGLGTMALIYAYLRKRMGLVNALLGALLFLSTPVIVKLCINVYVDLGLVFFSWACMYCLFEWHRSSLKTKYLLLAAIFCGLGMGTKYNGLLVLCLLTLSVPLVHTRAKKASSAAAAAKVLISPLVFVAVALAVFSPWAIKNYRWTGNPVYPLFNKVFADESDENNNQPASMKPWLQRKLIYRETAMQTALIPARIFFQGQDDNPRYFDGRLNPILFFFPLLAFFRFRKMDAATRTELTVMAGFSFFYLLYASFIVDMRIRYIAPILPPLVTLTVAGIQNAAAFVEGRAKALKICLVTLVSMFLVLNAHYLYTLMRTVEPMAYLSGSLSRAAYIEKFRPEYPLVQTANHLPGSKVKLLALFLGNRRYYFDKDVEFATETFKYAVETSASAKTVAEVLTNRGFTHVIVGVGLFKTWARSVFNNEKLSVINQFFNEHGQFVDSKNGYALYRIVYPNDH